MESLSSTQGQYTNRKEKKSKAFHLKSHQRKRATQKTRDKTTRANRELISKLSLIIQNLNQLNILTKTERLGNCIKKYHSTMCCQLKNEFRAEDMYIQRQILKMISHIRSSQDMGGQLI